MLVVMAFFLLIRRYGLFNAISGRRPRHAAYGRARTALAYVGAHTVTMVGQLTTVDHLVSALQLERRMITAS